MFSSTLTTIVRGMVFSVTLGLTFSTGSETSGGATGLERGSHRRARLDEVERSARLGLHEAHLTVVVGDVGVHRLHGHVTGDAPEHGVDPTVARERQLDLLPDRIVVEAVPEAGERAHRLAQSERPVHGAHGVGTLAELLEGDLPAPPARPELDLTLQRHRRRRRGPPRPLRPWSCPRRRRHRPSPLEGCGWLATARSGTPSTRHRRRRAPARPRRSQRSRSRDACARVHAFLWPWQVSVGSRTGT